MPNTVVVGRQSIVDRDGATVGYELLYRADPSSSSAGLVGSSLTGDQLTADVAVSAVEIGLEQVLQGRMAFLNADRGVLLGELSLPLQPRQAIVEVLETVAVDEEVVAGCRRLADEGYHLALDDFVGFEGDDELLELASVVKVDVRQSHGDALHALVARCRQHRLLLLAEKVETEEEYVRLRELGFDLFQGYYLDRPTVLVGRTVEPSRLSQLRMATLLLSESLELEDLLDVLSSDPALAVQVMRLAAAGPAGENRRKVATIRDAVLLAGSRAVQGWMALLLMRPSRAAQDQDQPSQDTDRFIEVLTRARAVELLAARHDSRTREMAFAAGLLSALDWLLGVPRSDIARMLELDEALTEAAFHGGPDAVDDPHPGRSRLGRIVDVATAYQVSGQRRPDPLVTATEVDAAFTVAFAWAARTLGDLR